MTRSSLALLVAASGLVACNAAAQFSGTVVTRNTGLVPVSVHEVRGLERAGPSLPDLAPRDVKLALLGPMRAPDTLRVRWSYAGTPAPAADSATVSVLPVPPLPAAGAERPDMLLTFTAERRWVVAWSAP